MLSRRFFSTTVRKLAKAEITTLSNGLTVISKPGNSKLSSIGLYLNSGARSENAYNSGVSTLFGNVLKNSSIAKKALNSGVKVSSTNAKELTGAAVASFAPGNADAAISTLGELVKNASKLAEDRVTVSEEVAKAATFAEDFENDSKKMVVEHMTATAFQGTSLALPSYGKAETLSILESQDISDFIGKNLLAANTALVAYGSDISHEKLVKAASRLSIKDGSRAPYPATSFLGSDVRLRDDTLPKAYVAISVKTPGAKSDKDYFTGLVAAHINGEFVGHDSLYTQFEGSKLSQLVYASSLGDYYKHFQLAYSDIGLWGALMTSPNIGCVDELIHFTLKSWNRMSTRTITDAELQKAKQEIKLSLSSINTDSAAQTEKLADSFFSKGLLYSDGELIQNIDSITLKDIATWANKYLYDQDIALAATGQIEDVFDYNRIRNDMSMLRW